MAGPLTLLSHEVAGYPEKSPAPNPSQFTLGELQRRFNESFGGWPQTWAIWQDLPNTPYGYPAFGFAWSRGGTGTVTDRQGGRDIPFIWSEIDLRGFRVLSRFLAETNPYAIGFLSNLVNYHMRKGFSWQVCRKGAKKTPYPTQTTDDPVVRAGQSAIDRWRDHNKWALISRELFQSWRVDGETGVRHFAQGYRNIPEIRLLLPEQIGHPSGDVTSDESFGFRTPEGDQAGPILAAHIWDMDGSQSHGEWVDADDSRTPFHWIKCNVSRFVKRGRPDFFPLQDMLDHVRQLLVNMVGTAVEQAKWAWIEKFPTATADQVANLIPKNATGSPGGSVGNLGQAGLPYFNARGGKIRGIEGNRQLEAGPAASPSGWIEALQAVLRACGIRWNFPEFFSGDASNNSFASALVSGSPLTVTIEGVQLEWGEGVEKPVALKALDLMTNAGFLTWEERDQLDIEITEPAVVTPKPGEETARRKTMNESKVLSLTTWQLQESLDPQHEQANFEEEAKFLAKLQASSGAMPGAPSGSPPSSVSPSPSPAPPGSADGDGSGDSFFGEEGAIVVSSGAYSLLTEAGRQGLVKKQITNKDGKRQTVWVRPRQEPTAQPRAAKPNTTVSRIAQKPMSEKALRAQASATRVDATIQRYAEEHNEPKFAKAVGGLSFKDNEPVDVVVGTGGVIQHGIELKTMVTNKANKITMKRSAMERKAEWEKANKATFHTVVIDDSAVFNAKGEGQHDESKRRIFYRRGFGSFRVAGMHEVKNVAELKKLLNTPGNKLPPAAQRAK